MNGNDVTAYNLTQHTPKSIINVAVLGAESTGKTTLCRDLAERFGCPWVPEYMRSYLQAKWDKEQLTCTWDDLLPIAQGQIKLENELALQAATSEQNSMNVQRSQSVKESNVRQYLFCDTSLFELMVYANWYYGDYPDALTKAALTHHYDLMLLTDIDTPWVADDLRDSPHQREEISAYFAHQLTIHNKPFHIISGDREVRVQQVVNLLALFNLNNNT